MNLILPRYGLNSRVDCTFYPWLVANVRERKFCIQNSRGVKTISFLSRGISKDTKEKETVEVYDWLKGYSVFKYLFTQRLRQKKDLTHIRIMLCKINLLSTKTKRTLFSDLFYSFIFSFIFFSFII